MGCSCRVCEVKDVVLVIFVTSLLLAASCLSGPGAVVTKLLRANESGSRDEPECQK